MCQINNRKINLKKDRVVYKFEKLHNGRWVSPFTDSYQRKNVVLKAKGYNKDRRNKYISEGFFHFVTNKRNAKREANWIATNYDCKARVVKCIIPHENNIIYVGTFSGICKSICSRKAIFTSEEVI